MRQLTIFMCFILSVLAFTITGSEGAEPIEGLCLTGSGFWKDADHSHFAVLGKCSDAYESGNYQLALEEWLILAEQGNAPAQFNVGQMYRRGQGVPQSNATAVEWWELSANQENSHAQTNLGSMYQYGRGVSKNYETAVKWFVLASEQGNASAQVKLGLMYANGQGVTQDNDRALMWWYISAHLDNKYGRELRDTFILRMGDLQSQKVRSLAVACVEKNYKGC